MRILYPVHRFCSCFYPAISLFLLMRSCLGILEAGVQGAQVFDQTSLASIGGAGFFLYHITLAHTHICYHYYYYSCFEHATTRKNL
jgi:hypothetical protein